MTAAAASATVTLAGTTALLCRDRDSLQPLGGGFFPTPGAVNLGQRGGRVGGFALAVVLVEIEAEAAVAVVARHRCPEIIHEIGLDVRPICDHVAVVGIEIDPFGAHSFRDLDLRARG